MGALASKGTLLSQGVSVPLSLHWERGPANWRGPLFSLPGIVCTTHLEWESVPFFIRRDSRTSLQ